MKGTIKEIRELQNGKKLILYDDINTSGGQSGSPVDLVKNGRYYTIGIHVGYAASINCNVATAITKDMHEWIMTTAHKMAD